MDKNQGANMEMSPPSQRSPPHAGPNPYVQPPGQPVAGYPPPPGYGTPYYAGAPPPSVPQQQQQQQQSVVVVNNQQQRVVLQHVQSFVGHIIFACFVFWCCNWLFGLIAFILASVASCTAVSDPPQARRLGQASLGLSIAGIIVTVLIVAITLGVIFGTTASAVSSSGTSPGSNCYRYLGTCYSYYKYVGTYGYCGGVKTTDNYCYSSSSYCPYSSYLGICYRYKLYIGTYGYCPGKKGGSYCYSNTRVCPHYVYEGVCYKYARYAFSYSSCLGVYDHANICYYS